jgi:hypothetical protein
MMADMMEDRLGLPKNGNAKLYWNNLYSPSLNKHRSASVI